jgi:hypothetical protein
MRKKVIFGLFSLSVSFMTTALALDKETEEKNTKNCFEFRVTCAGKSGFYDTVQATSWGEATKKINAKYPNCKATQVKQKDCE